MSGITPWGLDLGRLGVLGLGQAIEAVMVGMGEEDLYQKDSNTGCSRTGCALPIVSCNRFAGGYWGNFKTVSSIPVGRSGVAVRSPSLVVSLRGPQPAALVLGSLPSEWSSFSNLLSLSGPQLFLHRAQTFRGNAGNPFTRPIALSKDATFIILVHLCRATSAHGPLIFAKCH